MNDTERAEAEAALRRAEDAEKIAAEKRAEASRLGRLLSIRRARNHFSERLFSQEDD